MVDFNNRDEVEFWLRGRPRGDAIVIAARAALRVLPALATDIGARGVRARRRKAGNDDFVAVVLPVFRAVALPWVAAKYPAQGTELRFSSSAAAAFFAASDAASFAASDAASAAAASFAASDAASAAAASFASSSAAAFASSAAAAAADAGALEQGMGAGALAGQPLWPDGEPAWATEAWAELRSHLLARDEDWQVWTD